MKGYKEFERIYLCAHPVDFRKGVRALACLVDEVFGMGVGFEGLFVFVNRSRKGMRIVYWDKTGYAMWSKVLEVDRFPWLKKSQWDLGERVIVTQEQLGWLLHGVDPWKLRCHKEVKYCVM